MEAPYHLLEPPAADPQPAPFSEMRVPTHDGYLWPVARPDMVLARAIRCRMAEDAAELIRGQGEFGEVTVDDFRRLGWTVAQVKEHGQAAIALALDDRESA